MTGQFAAHALPHPLLDVAPPVFNVVGGIAICIDDLTSTVVHNLVPQVGIAPPLLAFELSICRARCLPPICDQHSLPGHIEETEAFQDLLLASRTPCLGILAAIQNAKEKAFRHVGDCRAPRPDLICLDVTCARQSSWL